MLSEFAFANALAILTGLVYLLFIVLVPLAPGLFRVLFNAQFLGADVASLFPQKIFFANFVATLVTLAVSAWLFGFAWAWLYNLLAR